MSIQHETEQRGKERKEKRTTRGRRRRRKTHATKSKRDKSTVLFFFSHDSSRSSLFSIPFKYFRERERERKYLYLNINTNEKERKNERHTRSILNSRCLWVLYLSHTHTTTTPEAHIFRCCFLSSFILVSP